MIPIKPVQEIDKMRAAGRILAEIMDALRRAVRPGLSTAELEKVAVAAMAKLKVRSAFKDYKGYPGAICVSINEEVVHGIPGPRRMIDGDIVSVDIGIEQGGLFVDMAKTFPVGAVDAEKKALMQVAEKALLAGIDAMRAGNKLFDISSAVQRAVEARGFSVVRSFVGHGIGRDLHEEPQVPNFGSPHTGPVLREGMVLAIEPMINAGVWDVEILDDGWTAVTKDRRPSAHFEHTVALGADGPTILTE